MGQDIAEYGGVFKATQGFVEEFGKERLVETVLGGIHLPAKEMIDFIRKGVADFTERKFLDDDGTLFIVKAL